MLANLSVVIILRYTRVTAVTVHVQLTHFCVSYISVKLEERMFASTA